MKKRIYLYAAWVFLVLCCFAAWFVLAQNQGTAPIYRSTTSTANPGTISPIFTGTLGQNAVSYDTTYNAPPLDPYTRATDANTLSTLPQNDVGSATCSSGSNDIDWSRNNDYLAFAAEGDAWIFHMNVAGPAAQVISTGLITGASGIHVACPFIFSRTTDNVFYYSPPSGDGMQIWKGVIGTYPSLTSNAMLVDLGTACPQLSGATGLDKGILDISDNDHRLAVAIGTARAAIGFSTFQVVYDQSTSQCSSVNEAPPSGPPGTVWAASTAFGALGQGGQYITPTTSNAGGYTFEVVGFGTSGATQPTWCQTVGCQVTDGTVVWSNVGIAGQYYGFGAASPTGILDVFAACTTAGNCSCWGGSIHDSQMTGNGNFVAMSNAGPSSGSPTWTQGYCGTYTGNAPSFSIWEAGTSITLACNGGVTPPADRCQGHDSLGTNDILNPISPATFDYSYRPLSNTLTFTQFVPGLLWDTHGGWPRNGLDTMPWINITWELLATGQDTGCGIPAHCPINLGDSLNAAYPATLNQARTIFGHSYSCGDGQLGASGSCLVPTGPNWSSGMTSTLNPTVTIITPTSGNVGNYSFEAETAGTAGGSAPTWPQTVTNTVTDGSITWANIGVAGGNQNDFNFGCQISNAAISQDGNWLSFSSGMLTSLGLNNVNQPRCDLFIVHIGYGGFTPKKHNVPFFALLVFAMFAPLPFAFRWRR